MALPVTYSTAALAGSFVETNPATAKSRARAKVSALIGRNRRVYAAHTRIAGVLIRSVGHFFAGERARATIAAEMIVGECGAVQLTICVAQTIAGHPIALFVGQTVGDIALSEVLIESIRRVSNMHVIGVLTQLR